MHDGRTGSVAGAYQLALVGRRDFLFKAPKDVMRELPLARAFADGGVRNADAEKIGGEQASLCSM